MKTFLLACLLSIVSINVSLAAAECYSETEFEAEQGLRIHSELMVIGLTCQHISGSVNIYSKYKDFTNRYDVLLEGYEDLLISYYEDQGLTNPDKELHELRTSLANKISQHAATMNTNIFCTQFKQRMDKALQMDEKTIRKWAKQVWPNTPTSRPLCKKL